MTVCLFGAGSAEYIDLPLAGRSTRVRVEEFVRSLPNVDRAVVFATEQPPQLPSDWVPRPMVEWTTASLLQAIADEVTGPDQSILFLHWDQPFVNRELAQRLIDKHEKYRADYTFADGYPVGLAPEIVRGRAVSHLVELSSAMDSPVARDSIFAVVQKDINRLDVETELSRIDQRLLRLTLAADTLANFSVCSALSDQAPAEIDQWAAHVEKNAAAHRSRPRFVSVQVLEQEIQKLEYSPYKLLRDDVLSPGATMNTDRFATIVSEIADLSPEAVVSISHWGEVALHPDVAGLVEVVLSHPAMRLIVETSGVGWSAEARENLLATGDRRLSIIVGIDSNDPAVYERVRGAGLAEAVAFAEAAIEAKPRATHVQAVRYDMTEGGLNQFYNHWKERTENIIIQKYDHFCDGLAQRKIGDLSPLKRFPCWHLQRDLVVLVDGSIPLCREDLSGKSLLGNAFSGGIAAAWEAGSNYYQHHIAGAYPDLCGSCDEYYTFNF